VWIMNHRHWFVWAAAARGIPSILSHLSLL
jgi:hypothetical protein